ncbi:cytochrome c oxidase subunit 4 [Microcella alkalica]|uniref:Cytochrome c oxidase polypeptide 4 n=1 Tax=Microcella alkalica TaxID=355930 RepID=A0A839EC09_9MICO|nr:cytochrome c oxidase subunit 4 [Microcella alkalica]MBA8847228.1 membrane protease YdiL (CAAX protease family) [Microcella alkalica]
MKTNINIFWILVAFFILLTGIYVGWAIIDTGEVEWVGSVGLGLCAILSAFIAFYLQLVNRSTGGVLPEDRLDADIDDGDPELGHFSPWSWWPVFLAAAVTFTFLGLAAGIWIMYYAVPLALLGLVGWVYEYYRGNFGR